VNSISSNGSVEVKADSGNLSQKFYWTVHSRRIDDFVMSPANEMTDEDGRLMIDPLIIDELSQESVNKLGEAGAIQERRKLYMDKNTQRKAIKDASGMLMRDEMNWEANNKPDPKTKKQTGKKHYWSFK
jgi:hypothetical protein